MNLLPAKLFGLSNKGESAVREAIEIQLDHIDGFALHSVGLSEHPYKPYSEADFVIICSCGIACLEVKGGEVLRRTDGIWQIGSESTGKYYLSSEGPFKQAQSASAALIAELKKNNAPFVPVVWGVVFPQCRFTEHDPEWRDYHICDISKIKEFEKFLTTLFKKSLTALSSKALNIQVNRKYSGQEIKTYKNILRKDIHVDWQSGNLIAESNSDLQVLENHQETILDELNFGKYPRMILRGTAGTGKTLLAIKAAQEANRRNRKTLFLVFNKLLACELKKVFSTTTIEVHTVHQFMLQFCDTKSVSAADQNFFKTHLPSAFYDSVTCKALEEQLSLYDFLICDEAQDFLTEEIGLGLFDLLEGGANEGRWLICFDDLVQSAVYGDYSANFIHKLEHNTQSISRELFRNFRNPLGIAKWANSLFPEEKLAIPSRNFNSHPTFFSVADTKDEIKKLKKIVLDFLNSGVEPRQISILTFCAKSKSSLIGVSSLGGRRFSHGDFGAPEDICWFQVGAFKGLENEIIIMVEVPDDIMKSRRAEYFVGLTRAKTAATVICRVESRAWEISNE